MDKANKNVCPNFSAMFSDPEREKILNAPLKDRAHPTKRILRPSNRRAQYVATNTERAVSIIQKTTPAWLKKIKPRLLEMDNYSDVSAVLGEIRAFGYMLLAGMSVEPIPETNSPTADFKIVVDEMEIFVEVHSKQYDGVESSNLTKFNNGEELPEIETRRDANGKVCSRMIEVTPFGTPIPGELVAENVISRMAAIKGTKKQFPEGKLAILWLDFQDELWDMGPKYDSIFPISTWNGEFSSGEFWYAFYGWNGAPIFEKASFNTYNIGNIRPMRHDGLFINKSKANAIFMLFGNKSILIENPFIESIIPEKLRKNIYAMPRFNQEYSYLRWPCDNLKDRINYEKDIIECLNKKLQEYDG